MRKDLNRYNWEDAMRLGGVLGVILGVVGQAMMPSPWFTIPVLTMSFVMVCVFGFRLNSEPHP